LKYTIAGFSQQRLVDMGLDLADANILRWFVDFQGTGRMREIEKADNYRFFQVSYAAVIRDLPILGIKDVDGIGRRFKRLVSAGVLEHYHHKVGGSFSTYRLSGSYDELVSDSPPPVQKSEGSVETSDPLRLKSRTPSVSKVGTKNSSINNSSINTQEEFSLPDSPGFTPEQVIDYLNEKAGKRFKAVNGNAAMIRARIKEGYTLADFKAVIDKRTAKWGNDPKMREYLRPETLFAPKHFESYLNDDTGTSAPGSYQGAPRTSRQTSQLDLEE
jgi:uncharacterized phage protein (TIGR02220 family)